jgi:hypothetical protein
LCRPKLQARSAVSGAADEFFELDVLFSTNSRSLLVVWNLARGPAFRGEGSNLEAPPAGASRSMSGDANWGADALPFFHLLRATPSAPLRLRGKTISKSPFRAAKPSAVFPPFQSIETKFHLAQIDPAVPGLVGFGKSRLETMVAHPEILVLNGDPLQQARLAEFFHMTRHHIRIAPDMAGDSLDAELPIAVQRGQNFQAIHFSNQTHQFGTIGYGGLVVAFAGPCQSGVVGCGVVQVAHGLILQIFEVESTLWVVSFTQKSKFRLRYEDSLWQKTKYRYICEENLMSISKNQCICEDNKSKTLKNPLACEGN